MNPAVRLWLSLATFVGSCSPLVPACAPIPAAPAPDSGDGGGRVCARHCSHRFAVGCLEPALAAHCEEICEKRRAQGYDAECAASAAREGMSACGVRCAP